MNTEVQQLLVRIERVIVAEQKAMAVIEAYDTLLRDSEFVSIVDVADCEWERSMLLSLFNGVSEHKRSLQIELQQALGIPVPQPSVDDIPF